MKEYFKMALPIFGKMVVINILCLFLVISMTVLTDALFTHTIGYTVFVTDKETHELVETYDFYYEDDLEDEKAATYDTEKYDLTKSIIRSKLSKTADIAFYTVTQLICLTMVLMFIYPKLWERGAKDRNLVSFGHIKEDKFKGFYAGLISIIPSALFTVVLMVLKPFMLKTFPVAIIKFVYCWSYSFNVLICGKVTALGDLSYASLVGLLLINLAFVAIPGVSYLLGYKNIAITEKLVYEKKR